MALPVRSDVPQLKLLLATATSHKNFVRVAHSLSNLCSTYTWVRALLNVHDSPLAPSSLSLLGAIHQCVTSHVLPGFKPFWWKHTLTPAVTRKYTHVWLVDSDLDFGPEAFPLETFVRLMHATNVSVLGPAPWKRGPGGVGLNELTRPHCHHSACGCWGAMAVHRGCSRRQHNFRAPPAKSQRLLQKTAPVANCAVCRTAWVEVKAPLFTSASWEAVYQLLLRHMPDSVLTGAGFVDSVWCGLLDHALHGCPLPWMIKGTGPGRHLAFGGPKTHPPCHGAACATSYATPIRDLDTHENIETVQALRFGRTIVNASELKGNALKLLYSSGEHDNRKGLAWLVSHRPEIALNGSFTGRVRQSIGPTSFRAYSVAPSWRIVGTMLHRKPCWRVNETADALCAMDGTRAALAVAEAEAYLRNETATARFVLQILEHMGISGPTGFRSPRWRREGEVRLPTGSPPARQRLGLQALVRARVAAAKRQALKRSSKK